MNDIFVFALGCVFGSALTSAAAFLQLFKPRKKAIPYRPLTSRKKTAIVSKLISRDGDRCRLCKRLLVFDKSQVSDPLYRTIDHIKPVSRGGSNVLENMQLLCGGCNREKSNG